MGLADLLKEDEREKDSGKPAVVEHRIAGVVPDPRVWKDRKRKRKPKPGISQRVVFSEETREQLHEIKTAWAEEAKGAQGTKEAQALSLSTWNGLPSTTAVLRELIQREALRLERSQS